MMDVFELARISGVMFDRLFKFIKTPKLAGLSGGSNLIQQDGFC